MKDFHDEIVKLSQEYVDKNIRFPTRMDYLLIQNAMSTAAVKIVELMIEEEKKWQKLKK